MADQIAFTDFERIDVRVGRIVPCEGFSEARKPAYKLTLDFSEEIGVRGSSAQIMDHYRPEDLIGTLALAVVNLPPRRIGPFISEGLTLGFPDSDGHVVLARPDSNVPLGSRMF